MVLKRKMISLVLIVCLFVSLLPVGMLAHAGSDAAGTNVFFDSFDNGLGKWVITSGQWVCDSVAKLLSCTFDSNIKGKIVSKTDSSSWIDYPNTNKNYEFSFRASYKDNGTDDRFVAIFRNDNSNFYDFKFVDASYTVVFGKNETTQLGTPVDVRTLLPGFSFNQMHSYRIIAFDNTFILYIDNVKILEASDNQITTGGNIGFIAKSAVINIDDTAVKAIDSIPTPPPSNGITIISQPGNTVPYNSDMPLVISVGNTDSGMAANVYYRYNNDSSYTKGSMQAMGNGIFNFVIPGSNRCKSVGYYIEASDTTGTVVRYPQAGGEVSVSVLSFETYSNDFESTAVGVTPDGWTTEGSTTEAAACVVTDIDKNGSQSKMLKLDGEYGINHYLRFTDSRYANIDNFKISFSAKYSYPADSASNDQNKWRIKYRMGNDSLYNDLEWSSHNSKYFIMRNMPGMSAYNVANYMSSLPKSWHDYTLEVSGFTHRLYIDAKLVAEGDDNLEGVPEKGCIELMTVGGLDLLLDNLRIEPLNPEFIYTCEPSGNFCGVYSMDTSDAASDAGIKVMIDNQQNSHKYTVKYTVSKADGNKEVIEEGYKDFAMTGYQSVENNVYFGSTVKKIGVYDVSTDFYMDDVKVSDKSTTMRFAFVRKFADLKEPDLDNESKFGANIGFDLSTKSDYFDTFRETGIKSARGTIQWNTIDKNNGLYDFASSDFERNYQAWTKERGINLIPIMRTASNSAYQQGIANTPGTLDAIRKFMEKTTENYKGKVRQWEMTNEPELEIQPYIPQELVSIQKESYLGMKEGDFNSVLLAGAHTSGVVITLPGEMECGSYNYTDGYSYHRYLYNMKPEGNIENFYNGVKGIINSYGGWKELYVTESGWPTGVDTATGLPKNPSVTQEWQRDYIVRTYLTEMSLDQSRVFEYFTYKNEGFDLNFYNSNWGITDGYGRPKLAYPAVNNLMTTMDGALMVGRLDLGDSLLNAQVYIKDGMPVIAAWKATSHTDNTSVIAPMSTVSIPVGVQQVTVRDLNGADTKLDTVNGVLNLNVTGSPVYILGASASVIYSSAAVHLTDKYNSALNKLNEIGSSTVVNADLQVLKGIKQALESSLSSASIDTKAASLENGIKDIYSLMKRMSEEIKSGYIDRVKGFVAMEELYNYAENASRALMAAKREQNAGASAIDYASILGTDGNAPAGTVMNDYFAKKGEFGLVPVSTVALMRAERYGRLAEKHAAQGDNSMAYVYNLLAREFGTAVRAMVDAEPVIFSGMTLYTNPAQLTEARGASSNLTFSVRNRTTENQDAHIEVSVPQGWESTQDILAANMSILPGETRAQPFTLKIPSNVQNGEYNIKVTLKKNGVEVDHVLIRVHVIDMVNARIMPLTTTINKLDEVTVRIKGMSSQPVSGKIILKDPAGNILAPKVDGTDSFTDIAKDEERDIVFKWGGYKTIKDFNEYICQLSVTNPVSGQILFDDLKMPLDFLLVQKANETITIDGSLEDWKDAYPIHLRGAERNYTQVYNKDNLDAIGFLKWDESNLYIAADVTDDIFKQSEPCGTIWKNDSLQFTFDPLNDKAGSYQPDDMEWGIAMDSDDFTPMAYVWNSSYPNPNGNVTDRISFKVVRDEYRKKTFYEAKIPVPENIDALGTAQMTEGKVIGYDLLVADSDLQDGRQNFIEWTKGVSTKQPKYYDSFTFVNIPAPVDIASNISGKSTAEVGEHLTYGLGLLRAENVIAEDIAVTYDADMFTFQDLTPADSRTVVHEVYNYVNKSTSGKNIGNIRIIASGEGASDAISGSGNIINLNLTANNAVGSGLIGIEKMTAAGTNISEYEVTPCEIIVNLVNKTALREGVSNAEMLSAKSVEGTGIGQYPTGAKSALENEISKAKLVRDNEYASQQEINQALDALNIAVAAFQKQIISEIVVTNIKVSTEITKQGRKMDNMVVDQVELEAAVNAIKSYTGSQVALPVLRIKAPSSSADEINIDIPLVVFDSDLPKAVLDLSIEDAEYILPIKRVEMGNVAAGLAKKADCVSIKITMEKLKDKIDKRITNLAEQSGLTIVADPVNLDIVAQLVYSVGKDKGKDKDKDMEKQFEVKVIDYGTAYMSKEMLVVREDATGSLKTVVWNVGRNKFDDVPSIVSIVDGKVNVELLP